MRDLKAEAWSAASSAILIEVHRLSPCRTASLLPAYRTFKNNARDAAALENFPTIAFLMGRQFQKAETNAYLKLIKKPYPENATEDPGSDSVNEETKKFFFDGNKHGGATIPMTSEGSSSHSFFHMQPLTNVLMQLMAYHLVAVWTIFETLAGDLWEAAVNSHPNMLASLSGTLNPNDKNTVRPDQKPRSQKQQAKSINLSTLQIHRFNVAERMGSILIDEDAVSFIRLSNIRDAYLRAFSENHTEIREAIYDHSLDALAICRNVIVHRAGVVDQEAIDRLYPDVQQLLPAMHLKHRLELNGEILNAIFTPAIKACCNLIRHVDAWLVHH